MSEERLQKILARAGVASRRHAEELIRAGKVTVNGEVATVGDKADPARDAIKVDGRRLQPPPSEHTYLLLNKPRGVVSTLDDPEGRPTVVELVPPRFRKALVPVGRLDFLTEGLLLLTDDGELAHRVSHPRYGCTKVYEVKVKGRPEEGKLHKLRGGIVLDGRRTAPSRITPLKVGGVRASSANSWWQVELGEGRTRQIREMFFRIGHPVQRLRRVAIGPLSDRRLPLGAVRELTEEEVELLRSGTRRLPAKRAAKRARGSAAKRGTAKKSTAKRDTAKKSTAKRDTPTRGPAQGGAAQGGPGKRGKAGPRRPGGGGRKAER